MLEKFNEIYNLPKGTPFRRLELEDAIVEKFGELKYNKFRGWTNSHTQEKYPDNYWASTKQNWELYDISTDGEYHGSNVEEALLALFIKYGIEPEKETEEYYVENYCKEFHEIVESVYKNC